MAEQIHDKKVFSLSEVARSIQKTLAERYGSSYWIKAEMIKLHHYPHSGHCYPEFVEKRDGKVVAQLKATLWKDDYLRINKRFEEVLKEPLKDGINILFCARITFEPLHGLSLRILDIDPAFSLGELERMKMETIRKLKEDGIFASNRQRPMPLLPQRIAVISVQTSKGYADFVKVIEGNAWGYHFFHMLFPSLLQGDNAVESIRRQLRRIRKAISHFDVVAIIRGGGGDIGLSCFNDERLSRDIALFPLPVITGIGHATNETVVEMVAYGNSITPTELADYLLQKFHDFSNPVQRAGQKLIDKVPGLLKDKDSRLQDATKYFRSLARNVLNRNTAELGNKSRSLQQCTTFVISRERGGHLTLIRNFRRTVTMLCAGARQAMEMLMVALKKDIDIHVQTDRHKLLLTKNNLSAGIRRFSADNASRLDHIRRSVDAMSPDNVLKRGYSITRRNGRALRNPDDAKPGDILQTELSEGTIVSEVKSVDKT